MTSRKPLSPHVFTPKWIFIAVLFSIVAIESRSQQKKTNQRTLGSITLNVQVSQPSCGYANGIIMVSASGGTLPYKYTLNGFTQNNGFFPEQTAYTYTLVVTDAAGQSTSQQVTLANTLPAPSLGVNVLKLPSTCTSFDGEVVLSASGGVPPYQYGNNNLAFSSNDTFKNLLEGEYIFFVRDANGCVAEKYFGFLNEFQCTSCCNMHINGYGGLSACKNDGFLDITGYGGTPPYTFSIDGINYFLQAYAGVSQQFSNLIARNYTLYMKDANGIIVMADYPLIEFCSLGISWVEVDASCKGSNGQLTIHATNGTLPYSFTMDGINFQADSLFTGLSAGVYAIAARDAHGILVSAIATVTDSCPTVTAIATNATCGQKNGSISAMGNKGTTPYQFSIDGVNFFASNVFSGLASGTYTVTIKDADGNTSKTSITVGNSCLQVTATTVASTCGNANGTIQASASNGLTPYEYSIDGVNFQASNIFQNLAPGNYTITVMDATGATGSTTIALAGSIGPLISLTLQAASCLSNDGTVTITGSGGTAPYLYSIDGINFLGSNVFSGIAAGATLNTQIKDSNGCIATEGATMTQDCPILNVTSKNETCASKNGSLTLNGSNGVGPYQYSIDGINFQTGNSFSGLDSGIYTVTVEDADGYENQISDTVLNVCPSVTGLVAIGACGPAAASVTVTGANGMPPYQYSIDGTNFQTAQTFANVPDGTYTITVKDAYGLTNSTTVIVKNFPAVEFSAVATAASCLNDDGKITVSVATGTSPFEYSIGSTSFQTTNTFANLDTGIKTVSVKDFNGCIATSQSTVLLIDNLTLSIAQPSPICQGQSATISASSNANQIAWSPDNGLNNAATLNPITTPQQSTLYYINATLGLCNTVDSVNIVVSPAPVAIVGFDTSICYGKSAQLIGGGGVSFSWAPNLFLSNSQEANPIVNTPTQTTTYNLTVKDADGCASLNQASTTITVDPPAKVFAGNDTSVLANQALQLIAIDVNNVGFNSYSWSPPTGLNNPNIQDPIAQITSDITFFVAASTADGCQGFDSISIKVYSISDILVPNAFTPNGDGINDILKPILFGMKGLKYFSIYNRWGQRIFYTTQEGQGWDGTSAGSRLSAGTYVWAAAASNYNGDLIERKGTVILIR